MVQIAATSACGVLLGLWGPAPGFSLLLCGGAILLTIPRPWLCLVSLGCGLLLGRGERFEDSPRPDIDGWVEVAGTSFGPGESVPIDGPDGRFLLYQAPAGLCPGDRLWLSGQLHRPTPSAHPGTFDPWRHLLARGARSQFRGQIVEQARVGTAPLCRLRQQAVAHWYRALLDEDAWLAAALTVGARPRQGKEGSDAFRRTGLAHLLAVSGLHIGFALMLVIGWLRWAPALHPNLLFDRRRKLIVSAFVATLMGAWCGWPVGGLRILSWLLLAWLLPRRSAWSTGVLSLSLLLLVEPRLGADAGFLLSHGAALLLVGLPWARRGLCQSACVAGLGTFPLLWSLGFSTSVFTPLTNVLFMPFFLVVFTWTWGVFAAATVLGRPELLDFAAAPLEVLRSLAALAVTSPMGWQFSVPFSMLSVLLTAFVLVAWVRRKWLAGAALLTVMVVPLPFAEGTRYWQLPVGHGDLALLQKDDIDIVIDTGPSPRRLESQLLPLLGHRPPDLVIISHDHPDHLGGLPALCRRYPLFSWRRPEPTRDAKAQRATEACGRPTIGHDFQLRLGDFEIQGLPAPDDWVRGSNERSLAVAVATQGKRWLFLGDIEADRELDLMGRLGRADGVKVPHHGSRTSSSRSLVQETTPRWAVITAGRDDRYGHPHPSVTQRWTRAGARVLPTDDRPVCLLLRSKRATRACPELAFLRPGPLTIHYGSDRAQPQPHGRTQGGAGRQW